VSGEIVKWQRKGATNLAGPVILILLGLLRATSREALRRKAFAQFRILHLGFASMFIAGVAMHYHFMWAHFLLGFILFPIDIAIRTRCALAHPVLVQAYASCPHMLTFVVPQMSSASRSSLGAQTLRTSFPELVLAVLVGTAFYRTAMNPEMEVSARLPMATTQHSHLPRSQWLLCPHRSHRNRTRWRLQ